MPPSSETEGPRWCRFAKYELDPFDRGGGDIRPAEGAEFEVYDPWAAYRAAQQSESEYIPPYLGLARVVQVLDSEWERDYLRLLHMGNGELESQWVDIEHRCSPDARTQLLEWCARYGLLGVELPRQPDEVPARYIEEWWRGYSEDLARFVMDASALWLALRPSRVRGPLNAHLRAVSPALDTLADGRVVQVAHSPSLTGHLAFMASLDLAEGWRMLDCRNCRVPFLTRAYQARYCSDRCRNAAQKRRHRARKDGREQ